MITNTDRLHFISFYLEGRIRWSLLWLLFGEQGRGTLCPVLIIFYWTSSQNPEEGDENCGLNWEDVYMAVKYRLCSSGLYISFKGYSFALKEAIALYPCSIAVFVQQYVHVRFYIPDLA